MTDDRPTFAERRKMSLVFLTLLVGMLVVTAAEPLRMLPLSSESLTKDDKSTDSTERAATDKEMMKLTFIELEGRSTIEKARALEDSGEITEAVAKYHQALALLKERHDNELIAYVHAQIGRILLFNNSDIAVHEFSESYDMYSSVFDAANSTQVDFLQDVADMLFLYGLAHWININGDEMSEIWEDCLSVYQSLFDSGIIQAKDLAKVGLIHYHLSEMHFNLDDYAESADEFLQSIQSFEKIVELYGMDVFHESLPPPNYWSSVFGGFMSSDKLLEVLERLHEGNAESVSRDELLEILSRLLKEKKELMDEGEAGELCYAIGVLTYAKGEDMNKAELYLHEAIQKYSSVNNTLNDIAMSMWYLSSVCLRQGGFKKSLAARKLTEELYETLENSESDEEVASSTIIAIGNFFRRSTESNKDESSINIDVVAYLKEITKHNASQLT